MGFQGTREFLILIPSEKEERGWQVMADDLKMREGDGNTALLL